jgi:hypothetical protein
MRTRRLVALAVSLILWTFVARPAGAGERLVFSHFVGAGLVTAGIDPVTGLLAAIDPARQYDFPAGIAVDSREVVYVADPTNDRVQVFNGSTVTSLTSFCCIVLRDASGNVITTLSLSLKSPLGVAVDPQNDDVWIANSGVAQVIKIDKNGQLLAVAGSPVGSPGTGNGEFESPVAVAVDSSGNLYVADDGGQQLHDDPNFVIKTDNIRIQKFTSSGTFLLKWGSFCNSLLSPLPPQVIPCNPAAPGLAVGDGQFVRPRGVAADSMGSVYVADAELDRVQKFNSSGTFLLKWGTTGNNTGQFNGLRGIAVDFADNVYTTELVIARVQKFDGSGMFLTTGGSPGTGLGVFGASRDIAAMPNALVGRCVLIGLLDPTILPQCQKVFVSEALNKRVQVLDARRDSDDDSILDEVDPDPNAFSNQAALGDTRAEVISRGAVPFTLYAPAPGLPVPLVGLPPGTTAFVVQPNTIRFTAQAGVPVATGIQLDAFCATGGVPSVEWRINATNPETAFDFHCSTPTLAVLTGPLDGTLTAADGTIVTATLNGGESLSVDPGTSSIRSNAGTVALLVGGTSVTLAPGQSVFADTTAPTTAAAPAPGPNQNGWNNSNVSVTLTAIDNTAGSGVKEIHFSLAGAQSGGGVASGAVTAVPVSAEGVTMLTYFARDNAGNQEAAKTLTVRIDKSGPAIAGLPEPGCTLWPPNHKLTEVAKVTPGGSLSGIVAGSLSVTATSNEPEDGLGDGDVSPDVVITGGVVSLRAERSALGSGRLYTIAATVTDLAGNVAKAAATCSVPHDRR